jgi:hypothetical protein
MEIIQLALWTPSHWFWWTLVHCQGGQWKPSAGHGGHQAISILSIHQSACGHLSIGTMENRQSAQ